MSAKELPAAVTELAGKIEAGLSYKEGKIEVDANTYLQTLPEGLTEEIVKQVEDHNSNFYPAATRAIGQLANKELKKDKDLQKVEATVPLFGKNKLELTVERKHVFPNPADAENPKTVFGNVKVSLITQSARASRGVMDQVRKELQDKAFDLYGK